MRFSAGTYLPVFLLAMVSAAACKLKATPPASAASDAGMAAAVPTDAGPLGTMQDAGTSVQIALVPQYAGTASMATWRTAKSIGHTSTVYLLKGDADSTRMAFKPDTKHGRGRYRGEIAARQLALALGIGGRVPEVVPASFERAQLRGVLSGPQARADFDADVVAQGDYVYGAGIAWVEGLRFPALHQGPARTEWESWLSAKAPVPADKRVLAASLSDMILFDYITGNFDRWSGGNIGQVGAATTPVLYVDNDGAFLWPEPAVHLDRQRELMLRTRVFSIDLYRKLDSLVRSRADFNRVLALPAPMDPFEPPLVEAVWRRLYRAHGYVTEVCAPPDPRRRRSPDLRNMFEPSANMPCFQF